jgi:hypothetical protein
LRSQGGGDGGGGGGALSALLFFLSLLLPSQIMLVFVLFASHALFSSLLSGDLLVGFEYPHSLMNCFALDHNSFVFSDLNCPRVLVRYAFHFLCEKVYCEFFARRDQNNWRSEKRTHVKYV